MSSILTEGDSVPTTPAKRTMQRPEEIAARRELVWSLDRRGFRRSQIIKFLEASGMLKGISDPYQMVIADIRIGHQVARKLRDSGNIEQAEAVYIGRLEELFTVAMGEKDVNGARQILHDWARAHGINVTEPLSVVVNQNTINAMQVINGSASEIELRAELERIGDEVTRLVGPRRLAEIATGEDESH